MLGCNMLLPKTIISGAWSSNFLPIIILSKKNKAEPHRFRRDIYAIIFCTLSGTKIKDYLV